jgi:hypothetical protein
MRIHKENIGKKSILYFRDRFFILKLPYLFKKRPKFIEKLNGFRLRQTEIVSFSLFTRPSIFNLKKHPLAY